MIPVPAAPAKNTNFATGAEKAVPNSAAGLILVRENPREKDRRLLFPLGISPHIASSMPEGYSNYYHKAFVPVCGQLTIAAAPRTVEFYVPLSVPAGKSPAHL
jgi:hypothetical protein